MAAPLTITDFFKPQLHARNNMEDNKRKKLNLSLKKKTPTKTPKLHNDVSASYVIDLSSDDENFLSEPFTTTISSSLNESGSDASDSTIIYSPTTPTKSLSQQLKSVRSQSENVTPKSTSLTPPSKSVTPKQTFYSPTKKRSAALRSTNKARKNLSQALVDAEQYDNDFIQLCHGLDDKTVFMLKVIHEFLKEESLNHLLCERSCNLLKEFMTTTKHGLKLVCNLYGRKERWYRWADIKNVFTKSKKPIDDSSCHIMMRSLLEKDIIVASNYQDHKYYISFDEYANILKKNELSEICKYYKLTKVSSKQDSMRVLKGFCKQKTSIGSFLFGAPTNNESRVINSLAQKAGPCFNLSELTRKTLNDLYVLMYLGMDYSIIKEKKLELTLINDKANIQTFPYDKNFKTDNASVIFKSREEFQRYLNALSLYDVYSAETNLNSKCDLIKKIYEMYKDIAEEDMERYAALHNWLYKFTPPNIYIRILEDSIKFLKKDKEEKERITLALDIISTLIAQTTFRQHKKSEWYAEKALILDKFRTSDEAASTLLEGFNLDLPDESKDVLRPRAALLARRQTNAVSDHLRERLLQHAEKEEILERQFDVDHVYKQPMDNTSGGKLRFESRTADGRVVQDAEDFCLSHYLHSGNYTHGGHWEGRIITTIFFLAFWDVIYAPLPAVVLSRYQVYPLDMWGDGFYRNRKGMIRERLAYIERSPVEVLLEDMRKVWDTRPETELSGINRAVGWEAVGGVSRALGGAGLAALCRRLAAHYGRAHAGFPDLSLWNEHTNQILFVEVKTDSDKPSMKQLQWMQYLRQHNLPARFCYVGVHTARNRARRDATGRLDD